MTMRRSLLLTIFGAALVFLAVRAGDISPARTTSTELPAATAEAVAASASHSRSGAATSSDLHAVTRIVDGDTIVVDMSGVSTKVRLIGLDTPESVDPRKPVQCFGVEAANHARELLAGKSVRLEFDPSQGQLDRYGRTLAYIFLPDGTNFAERMIAEGYGHEYTYRLPYKYQSAFKAAEKTARDAQLGLWADAACAAQSAR